jgi:predicted dehydrogenase
MEIFTLPEGFERNDLFIAQTRHFLNVVHGTESSVCTLEDGIQAQRLVQAAHQSEAGGGLITLARGSKSNPAQI